MAESLWQRGRRRGDGGRGRSGGGRGGGRKDPMQDLERLAKVQDKEERLKTLLSPAETYILLAERVLVWEQPYMSAALLIAVNLLFWSVYSFCRC